MELSQLKVPKVHMALNDVTHVKTLELKNFVQPSLDCVGAVFCQQTKSMKVQHEFHFTHTCCFLALWEIVSIWHCKEGPEQWERLPRSPALGSVNFIQSTFIIANKPWAQYIFSDHTSSEPAYWSGGSHISLTYLTGPFFELQTC